MNDSINNNQKIWKYIKERCDRDPNRAGSVALIDCTREYTYEQMFQEWNRYARAFSGLGICSANKSRVAICGAISTEPIFAFYGLNMVGAEVSMFSYPDFLSNTSWRTMLQKEKITDLVITDIMVTPQLWREINQEREELGLRNVILMHSKVGGPTVGPAELIYNEFNYQALKRIPDTVFMDKIIHEYEDTPIRYSRSKGDKLAVITHTSGTTNGTRKPLPFTDKAINTVATNFRNGFHDILEGPDHGQLKLLMQFDFSSFLAFAGMCNSTLAVGDTVVLTFFGFMHPKYVRAVEYYGINVINGAGFMFDRWTQNEEYDSVDFSSLDVISVGGSYLPVAKLNKYIEFCKAHGYKYSIRRGYGMSETGGAQLNVPPGCNEDILGYPDNIDNYMIQDENDNKFYTLKEGPRTGIMYVASDSLCMNTLDGVVLFEYTEINGRNYICTNDKMKLNDNGSLSYAGRTDKFFVNNDGVRFDSGIVDREVGSHPAVNLCAIVPVMDKRIHDTVPVLYVVPNKSDLSPEEVVRNVLLDIYVHDKSVSGDNIPVQFVITESIPCNANGKVDVYRITRERLEGVAYNIVPVRENGEIVDIAIEYVENVSSIAAGTLPEGMDGRSAFNLFDVFDVNMKADYNWKDALKSVIEMIRCNNGKKK